MGKILQKTIIVYRASAGGRELGTSFHLSGWCELLNSKINLSRGEKLVSASVNCHPMSALEVEQEIMDMLCGGSGGAKGKEKRLIYRTGQLLN